MINLIFCISNILKGDNANRLYFYEQGGVARFLTFILQSQDLQLISLCVQSLKEIATLKSTLIGMNESDLLTPVFVKCLGLTDNWNHSENGDEGEDTIREAKQNDLNIMEKLVEEQDDSKRSILFASKSVLIRNSIYYVLSRCIKVGFPVSNAQCSLVKRIMADLSRSKDNYFLFENIVMAFSSLEKDPVAVEETLMSCYPQLFKMIHEYPSQVHKIAVSIIHCNLSIVVESCNKLGSQGFRHSLFTRRSTFRLTF